jgi:hypothetical protein
LGPWKWGQDGASAADAAGIPREHAQKTRAKKTDALFAIDMVQTPRFFPKLVMFQPYAVAGSVRTGKRETRKKER